MGAAYVKQNLVGKSRQNIKVKKIFDRHYIKIKISNKWKNLLSPNLIPIKI